MYETDLKEIEKRLNVGDFPLNIILEPGNFCNLNCITCANDKLTRPKGQLNILLFKKIVNEIAEVNPYTRLWLDFYGEPLIQKYKIYYYIKYAKERGLKSIEINTNGTLLDQEMAEMILDSGIDFLSIDCDGYSKEVYEKIRVNANRDVTYSNIEYLLKRKAELGVKKPIIEVKTMEMDENKDEVDKIISYWRKRGAWTAKRRLVSWGGKMDELRNDKFENRVACGYAIGTLAITWDGKAVICAMDVDAEYVCGDANTESIAEIWKRRKDTFITKHMEHKWDELPLLCQNCTDWKTIGEERFDEKGNPINKSYDSSQKMI